MKHKVTYWSLSVFRASLGDLEPVALKVIETRWAWRARWLAFVWNSLPAISCICYATIDSTDDAGIPAELLE